MQVEATMQVDTQIPASQCVAGEAYYFEDATYLGIVWKPGDASLAATDAGAGRTIFIDLASGQNGSVGPDEMCIPATVKVVNV